MKMIDLWRAPSAPCGDHCQIDSDRLLLFNGPAYRFVYASRSTLFTSFISDTRLPRARRRLCRVGFRVSGIQSVVN
jgi:hypothetical protein